MRRTTFISCAILCLAFAFTGPWHVASYTIRSWQPCLAVCAIALLTGTGIRAWINRPFEMRPAHTLAAAALLAAILVRIWIVQYQAFEVNAWDFSVSFDRPIEQTLHGNLLWSDAGQVSMLSIHCNWLLLLFVPLYRLVATPYWLLVAQPLAIVAGGVLLFLFSRIEIRDDLVAACLSAAFVLNHYTVRATHHSFIIDGFYPAAFFLLLYGFARRDLRLGVVATLLVLSIKEDAILTLAGFALVAGFRYKEWRWVIATMTPAIVIFVTDYFVVLPRFGGPPVTFAHYWGSFGPTAASAAIGMLTHPWVVARRVADPAFQLFVTMAFVPLFDVWVVAAAPALILYTSSDTEDLHSLALHYSLPFIGLVFAALPGGTHRLAKMLNRSNVFACRRVIALVVLLTSAFAGSGYEMAEARPERRSIPALLGAAGQHDVYIQGALFPHVGYATQYRLYHDRITPEKDSAFLLCSRCNPYPFTREEFALRFNSFRHNSRYAQKRVGDLWLFAPH